MTDVDVQGTLERVGLTVVQQAGEVVARDGLARGTNEDFEDLVFDGGYLHGNTVSERLRAYPDSFARRLASSVSGFKVGIRPERRSTA